MHPAPMGVADRTRKKKYWCTVPGQLCLLAHWCPPRHYYWRTDPPCANRISAQKNEHLAGPQSITQSARLSLQSSDWDPISLSRRWVCPPFGTRGDTLAYRRGVGWGPNTRGQTLWYPRYVSCNKFHIVYRHISVRLAYFHSNLLLTGLYEQEMEILWRKDNGNIKKQRDIDRHGPEPSLNSSQPPDPPYFSSPTTFKHRCDISTIHHWTEKWRSRHFQYRYVAASFQNLP